MATFEYTSLHQYLDCVFQSNPNATHAEVTEAKAAYWKMYYSHYRQEKRKKRKEFALGFYPKQMEQIHQKRGKKTVSQFLYETIFKELQSENSSNYDSEFLAEIHLQLRQLINLIEECLDADGPDSFVIALEKIEDLEERFAKLLNA